MKLATAVLLIAGLPGLASGCAAAGPTACSPRPAVQQPNPAGDAGEDYWTPERLRNAKPREVRPTGPLEGGAPAPPCPSESKAAPGSPGTGAVGPDPNHVIVPMAPADR